MSTELTNKDRIIGALKDRASNKQSIYRTTRGIYNQLKDIIKSFSGELHTEINGIDENVAVKYKEYGEYEIQLKFSGDVLIFSMHTNVFNFDDNHFLRKTKYVKDDPTLAYCGMIQIHNFLADSYKFNRLNDVGYLIGRIFINREKHFMVEGKGQLGFLFNDFQSNIATKEALTKIVEAAMLYTIDFDLLVPPYNQVSKLSLAQQIAQRGTTALKTGKRVGFEYISEEEN